MVRECLNCGKILEIKPKTKPKEYCSSYCRSTYFYKNRNIKLCRKESITRCEYCGKEFDNWNNPTRKYCCHGHYIAARYNRKPDEMKDDEKSYKVKLSIVMQCRSEGLSCSKIAKELGMPLKEVERLVFLNEDEYSDSQIDESELIKVCELPQTDMRRIFLICGSVSFGGKYDSFAAKIPNEFVQNLQIGDVFAFCNRTRHQISILEWQGDGYVLMFRRTEEEKYPWPESCGIKVVEITRSDLETLMGYPRFIRRLKGFPTPEILY